MTLCHGSPATPPLARKSGRYTCLGMLGKGTYGTCYKVLQKPSKTPFVMKVIPIAELKTYDVHAAFSEAMLLSTIKHPHVVGYLDAWVENSHLYIVMEYCNRGDLAARLQRASEPLPIAEVLQYGRDISCGMQYLHSHKIMHRDVKPSNLFLHGDRLVIGDLGLGKHMEQLSVATTQVGTPLYFSPEVCREEPYAFPSDVWAFGCVLYEMLAGAPPFVASNQAALTEKICQGPTPVLPQSCPSHLSQIIVATLQKLPHRRPSMDQCYSLFSSLCRKSCHLAPDFNIHPSDKCADTRTHSAQQCNASTDPFSTHQLGPPSSQQIQDNTQNSNPRQSPANQSSAQGAAYTPQEPSTAHTSEAQPSFLSSSPLRSPDKAQEQITQVDRQLQLQTSKQEWSLVNKSTSPGKGQLQIVGHDQKQLHPHLAQLFPCAPDLEALSGPKHAMGQLQSTVPSGHTGAPLGHPSPRQPGLTSSNRVTGMKAPPHRIPSASVATKNVLEALTEEAQTPGLQSLENLEVGASATVQTDCGSEFESTESQSHREVQNSSTARSTVLPEPCSSFTAAQGSASEGFPVSPGQTLQVGEVHSELKSGLLQYMQQVQHENTSSDSRGKVHQKPKHHCSHSEGPGAEPASALSGAGTLAEVVEASTDNPPTSAIQADVSKEVIRKGSENGMRGEGNHNPSPRQVVSDKAGTTQPDKSDSTYPSTLRATSRIHSTTQDGLAGAQPPAPPSKLSQPSRQPDTVPGVTRCLSAPPGALNPIIKATDCPTTTPGSFKATQQCINSQELSTEHSNRLNVANLQPLKDASVLQATLCGIEQPLSALVLPHGSNVALHSSGVSSCVCSSPQPPTWCSPNGMLPPPDQAATKGENHQIMQHQQLQGDRLAVQNSLQERMRQMQQQKLEGSSLQGALCSAFPTHPKADCTAPSPRSLGADQASYTVSAPFPLPSAFTGGQALCAATAECSSTVSGAPLSAPFPSAAAAQSTCAQTAGPNGYINIAPSNGPLGSCKSDKGQQGRLWWPTVYYLSSPFCSAALPEASRAKINRHTSTTAPVDCSAGVAECTSQYAVNAVRADSGISTGWDPSQATESTVQRARQIQLIAPTDSRIKEMPLRLSEALEDSYPDATTHALQPHSVLDADQKSSEEFLPAGFFSEKPARSSRATKAVNSNAADGGPAYADLKRQAAAAAAKSTSGSDACVVCLDGEPACPDGHSVVPDQASAPAEASVYMARTHTVEASAVTADSQALRATGPSTEKPTCANGSKEKNLDHGSTAAPVHTDTDAVSAALPSAQHSDAVWVSRTQPGAEIPGSSAVPLCSTASAECEKLLPHTQHEHPAPPYSCPALPTVSGAAPKQQVPLQHIHTGGAERKEKAIGIGCTELELKTCYNDAADTSATAAIEINIEDVLEASEGPEIGAEKASDLNTITAVNADGVSSDTAYQHPNIIAGAGRGIHRNAAPPQKQKYPQFSNISSPITAQCASGSCLGCMEAQKCVDTLKSRIAGLETLLASSQERAAADRSALLRMTKEHTELQECLRNGGTLSLSPGMSILRHPPPSKGTSPPPCPLDAAAFSPAVSFSQSELTSHAAKPSECIEPSRAAEMHASEACILTAACTPRRLHTRAHVPTPADLRKLLERSLEASRSPQKSAQTLADAAGSCVASDSQFMQAAHAPSLHACGAHRPPQLTLGHSLFMHEFNASGSTNNEAQSTLSTYASPVEANVRMHRRHAWVDESPDLSPAACTLQQLPERMNGPHASHGSSGLHQSCGRWFGSKSSGSGSRLGQLGPLQLSAGSASNMRMHSAHACDLEHTDFAERVADTDATVSHVETARENIGNSESMHGQHASDLEHANLCSNQHSLEKTASQPTDESLLRNVTPSMHATHALGSGNNTRSAAARIPQKEADKSRDGSYHSVNSRSSHENLLDTISDMRRTLEEDCGASPPPRSPQATKSQDTQQPISSHSVSNFQISSPALELHGHIPAGGIRQKASKPDSTDFGNEDACGKGSLNGVFEGGSVENVVLGVLTGIMSQMGELQHAVQEVSEDISSSPHIKTRQLPAYDDSTGSDCINLGRISRGSKGSSMYQSPQPQISVQDDMSMQAEPNSRKESHIANQDRSGIAGFLGSAESAAPAASLSVQASAPGSKLAGSMHTTHTPTRRPEGHPKPPVEHPNASPLTPRQPPLRSSAVVPPHSGMLGRYQGTANFTPSPAHKRQHLPPQRLQNVPTPLPQPFQAAAPPVSSNKHYTAGDLYKTPAATPVKLAPSTRHHDVDSRHVEMSKKAEISRSMLSPATFSTVPSFWTPQPQARKLNYVSFRPNAPSSASKIAAVWTSGANLETSTYSRNLSATPPRPTRASRNEGSD